MRTPSFLRRRNRTHYARLDARSKMRAAWMLGMDGRAHVCGDIDAPRQKAICGRAITENLPADPPYPPPCPTCRTRRRRSVRGKRQTP